MKHSLYYVNEGTICLQCRRCGKKFTVAETMLTENQCCHGPLTPETPPADPPDKQ